MTRTRERILRLAQFLFLASAVTGCINYHTQDFEVGANNLEGRQLYFIPTPGDSFYHRVVIEGITLLPDDPVGDSEVLFADGPLEVFLGSGNAISYYGELYEQIFIGADGVIGLGEPGGNMSLEQHFQQPQVSLLRVDELGEGIVSFDVIQGDSVAVTYEGVIAGGEPAVAQAQFFIAEGESYGTIALTYVQISPNAAGVIGLSNGQLAGADQATIDRFVADFALQAPLTTETMTGAAS